MAGPQVWTERLPKVALLLGSRVTQELWEVQANNNSTLRYKAGGGPGHLRMFWDRAFDTGQGGLLCPEGGHREGEAL